MDIRKIADHIGVENWPDCFSALFRQVRQDKTPACDLELLEMAQREYQVFGDYYEEVVSAAREINEDPLCGAWIKTCFAYLSDKTLGGCGPVPVPPMRGEAKLDFLMLMALTPFIPSALETYKAFGFPQEEITGYLQTYGYCIANTKAQTGFLGLNKTYFNWLGNFAKAKIFKVHGVQFEFTKLKQFAYFIRNKQTGQVLPLSNNGTFHESGALIQGADGHVPSQGDFIARFREDEESFYGHAAYDCVVSATQEIFPKSDWEMIAKPGQRCFAIHLPRGTDISPENIKRAYAAACEIAKRVDPADGKLPVQATTWILEPRLRAFLRPGSNLLKFAGIFVSLPVEPYGRAANSFVFPGLPKADADLPEDTSLQRNIKQHYLNGGHTYRYYGLMLQSQKIHTEGIK